MRRLHARRGQPGRRRPGLAAAHTTSRSPITVVDQFSGFNDAADTIDGVHPNSTTGIQKVANKWYPALTTALG